MATSNAIRVTDLINTMGVNTHIPYTDGKYVDVANVIADLKYLGINQIRDGISNGSAGSAPLSSYIALAKAGMTFTFLIGTGGPSTTAALQSQLGLMEQVNTAVPGSVIAIEGANEINNWPVTFNGVGGLQGAVDLQKALYASVHADPKLAGVAVDYFTGYSAGGLGAGPNPATTAGLADFDTQHPYPSGGQAPAAFVNPASVLPNEGTKTGPVVYTETGYSTYGTGSSVVSEDVQAKYTLDMLLDDAKNGVSKTYLYQLMDAYAPGSPQGDDGFGLFNPSGAPKEVATAIHNLTTILADQGANAATFTTKSFGYSVSGLPSSNTLLVEKSNGIYDLALWSEPQIWNAKTRAEIAAPTINVTVQFGSICSVVEIFDPLVGTAPIQVLVNVGSVKVGVKDHPLIVEVGDTLTSSQIAALTTTQIRTFTSTQIAALTTSQIQGVTSTQIGALSNGQIAGVTSTELSALTTTQLRGLTAAQVKALTTKQVAGLTATELAALTNTQLGGLTATQIHALTAAQVSGFSASELKALTTTQVGGLSASAIVALSVSQVAGLGSASVKAMQTTLAHAFVSTQSTALYAAPSRAVVIAVH